MMKHLSFAAAVVVTTCVLLYSGDVHTVEAFSTGAGGCAAGNPLGTPHFSGRTKNITGSLADGGFQVTIDGKILNTTTPYKFIINEDHDLTVEVNPDMIDDDKFFRGFLVRLGEGDLPPEFPPELVRPSVDTTEYLTIPDGSDDIKISDRCLAGDGTGSGVKFNPPVGGVTHTDANNKTSVTATLRVNPADNPLENGPIPNLQMDITLVVQNRGDTSEWYYDRFILSAGFPECNICEDKQMCNPKGIIDLTQFQQGERQCDETYDAGLNGFVPPMGCTALTQFGGDICCQEGSCSPTISPAPTKPIPVTAEPTPSTSEAPPSPATSAPTAPAPTSGGDQQMITTFTTFFIVGIVGVMLLM